MGKSKKKRRHAESVESRMECEDDASSGETQHINELLSNITNAEYEETIISSLAALANLAMGEHHAALFAAEGLVRQLAPLLLHKNNNIKEMVAGTLRNISVSGGVDACTLMTKQDIMTSLSAAIKQSSPMFSNNGSDNTDLSDLQNFATQLVNLTWNLCEASTLAINLFNEENLVVEIVNILLNAQCQKELSLACVHCLYAVSEDNLPVAKSLAANQSFISHLNSIIASTQSKMDLIVLQSLAAGVLYNIISSIPELATSQNQGTLVASIACVLSIAPPSDETNKKADFTVDDFLYAQQICLELLSNLLCAADAQSDEWEDVENDDSDNVSQGSSYDDATTSEDPLPEVTVALLDEIKSGNVLPMVIQLCARQPTSMDETNLIRSQRVQSRALLCLNNILLLSYFHVCLNDDEMTKLWLMLMTLTSSQSEDGKLHVISDELVDAASSALRSLASLLATRNSQHLLNQETIHLLLKLMTNVSVVSVQINSVAILGAIGKCLCKKGNNVDELKAIGMTFLSILKDSSSLMVTAEALDGIFETFADGVDASVNAAFQSLGMFSILKTFAKEFNTKVRSEKRQLADDYHIVNNARINLVRFIKYKERC